MKKKREYRNEYVKRITIRNTFYTLVGYSLPVISSYIAISLDLTSCTFEQMHLITLLVVGTVSLFLIYIHFKKEITYKLSETLGLAQLINWLFVYSVWLFYLNEIKLMALFSAMIPFVFFFSIGSVKSSLAIIITFHIVYIAEAYYCIYHLGQINTFKQDLFYAFCFFYSSLFLVGITHIYKKQKKITKIAKMDAEEAKKKLEITNYDLTKTYTKIKKTVDDIFVLSEMVAKDSAGITDSSMNLSKGANIQATEINEIAKTMEQINLKTSENAENAIKANELSLLTRDSSSNGVLHMEEVNSAMSDINSSSKGISKIISTIDSISFQTNLLALNASVEAARAGKQGKGFAVVAQEVRNLALKAAKAASDTADLIQISLDNVENGTETSETAAKALDDINSKIMDVTQLVENISKSSNEQTTSISQVNTAMSKISKVTGDTAQSAHETSVAAARLAETAVKIHRILKEFEQEKGKVEVKNLNKY
ncbi:MAG: methyl-accepting chemotaxis protein [Deltaproteobacteria bacterium]|nr:methyl-accepting chemotaxis protein [Deltaproteobacteria bacterium]